jgi:hypothetical protein
MKKGDHPSENGDFLSQIKIREIAHPRREISLSKKGILRSKKREISFLSLNGRYTCL